ncbi:Arc family DNA-binding protein [Salinarimonas sp. NSM]|uniref:Arc family DNA-binding protein n=1 Tax=Salinarimonas sp. NSM TaxID=3458003 RepID=UPI0040374B02
MSDRLDIQFKIRLSPAMKDRLEAAAHDNRRSVTAEIIARLEKTLDDDDHLAEMEKRLSRLEERVDALDFTTGTRDPYNDSD